MATEQVQPVRFTASLRVPDTPIWRLTVAQYHQMIQSGILTDDDPVELLEGWLVTKMPKNPAHRLTTQLLREAIANCIPAGWYVDAQEPITTNDSEPEPDIVVVRGNRRDYRNHHPGPNDLALVVEVSDTTLQRDRTMKQRLYAAAGIDCYWIVNLPEAQIEVYRQPDNNSETPHYRQRDDYPRSSAVPLLLDDALVAEIQVEDVLE